MIKNNMKICNKYKVCINVYHINYLSHHFVLPINHSTEIMIAMKNDIIFITLLLEKWRLHSFKGIRFAVKFSIQFNSIQLTN